MNQICKSYTWYTRRSGLCSSILQSLFMGIPKEAATKCDLGDGCQGVTQQTTMDWPGYLDQGLGQQTAQFSGADCVCANICIFSPDLRSS